MTITSVYDFQKGKSTNNWRIVDDGVMGGLSKGKLTLDDEGHGVFSGIVSLENNGGFSSLRYRFNDISVENANKVVLQVKGDGKNFQFRVKDKINQYHSYIYEFETSGKWQTIEIPFKNMYPSFRGRKLSIPNFNHSQIEEIAFLIGNKKAESFELKIDKIYIK
ncbi:CIA30 family protein [Bacteroidia bacterium]|nr:CIA30 family protein [Bacteroidia bacterium]